METVDGSQFGFMYYTVYTCTFQCSVLISTALCCLNSSTTTAQIPEKTITTFYHFFFNTLLNCNHAESAFVCITTSIPAPTASSAAILVPPFTLCSLNGGYLGQEVCKLFDSYQCTIRVLTVHSSFAIIVSVNTIMYHKY